MGCTSELVWEAGQSPEMAVEGTGEAHFVRTKLTKSSVSARDFSAW